VGATIAAFPFQKRIPVTEVATSERNFSPRDGTRSAYREIAGHRRPCNSDRVLVAGGGVPTR